VCGDRCGVRDHLRARVVHLLRRDECERLGGLGAFFQKRLRSGSDRFRWRERGLRPIDLAALYGVATKRLNEQVRRNRKRFPEDFIFLLRAAEVRVLEDEAARADLKSQIATSRLHGGRRYLPYAFTEHGAIMAANVLNSERAIEASVEVVRAFVRLRQMVVSNTKLAGRLDELEGRYDKQFKVVFDAIRALMAPAASKSTQIGFRPKSLKK